MTYQSAGSASRVPLTRASHSVQNPLRSLPETLRRSFAQVCGVVSCVTALMLTGTAGASAQAPVLQPNWNQLSPGASPSLRNTAAITYDAAHGQIVLFGGFNGSYLNDTWLFNGTTWTQANPAHSPSPRSNVEMVYDPATGNVVLFGGLYNASIRYNDTWVWDGTDWTQLSPGNIPTGRASTSMVYDAATSKVVMFGGLGASGTPLGDTWLWDGANWNQASPQSSPSARLSFGMAYDAATSQVVLFGGLNASFSEMGDTWTWNGTNWTQQSPPLSPGARDGVGMAYDPALGQVLLFGGESSESGPFLNDTWEWNGTSWTTVPPGFDPAARDALNGITYDAALGQLILFGGVDSSTDYTDTWEFGLPQNFGNINVCPASQSTPAPCSTTLALTFDFAVTTTINSINVVTQGATGLDFKQANGGNCAGQISAGNSCTMDVTFTPLAPGLRTGAVQFTISSGGPSQLVSTPIYGVGQGAVAVFSPLSTLVENVGNLTGPKGVLVDAAGDLFVSDYEGGKVVEVGPSTSNQVVTVAQSPQLSRPQGLAMDGAGNLYVADTGIPGVVKIPWGCTTSACQQTVPNPLGLSGQFGVSVDPQGDLFVSAYNQGVVVEVPVDGGAQTPVYNGNTPIGTAVDAAGNLFVADAGGAAVIKVPAGCTNSGCYVPIGSNWNTPQAVSLDAAGDLYVTDSNLKTVVEIPAGCVSSSCQITIASTAETSLGSGFQPWDAVPDGQGNIYIADHGLQRVDAILQQFAGLNFSASTVNNISGDSPQSVLFQNIGNQALTASAPGLKFTDPDFYQIAGSGTPADCSSAFSLAPSQTCNLSVDFDPLSAGPLTGNAVFTDNAFNAAATQSLAFNGTGQAAIPSNTLSVIETGSGSGGVTSGDGAINCSEAGGNISGTCSANYSSGTVTLTATPVAGSAFLGWSGGTCSGTVPTCAVTMNTSVNVTASFGQQSAGSVNVCSSGSPAPCTGSIPVTFNFTATRTIASVKVVTQGDTTLDFQQGTGGTCIGTITAGNSCIVNVNFVPRAPGLRMGAVELLDGSGNVLASQFISGIGQGPEISFNPATQVTVNTGNTFLSNANAVAVDAGGDVFISDSGNGQIVEVAANTNVSTITGINSPQGLAVDGAGDLFVAQSSTPSDVVEFPAGCTSNACGNVVYNPGGNSSPSDVAVDGAGDLFIADAGLHEVVEIPAGGGTQTVVYPSSPNSTSVPTGVAVDAAGDLFIADSGLKTVAKLPAGGGAQIPFGGGWITPNSVAVDAAGDIYVVDTGLTEAVEVPATCSGTGASSSCMVSLSNLADFPAVALALDGSGDIFVAESSPTQVVELQAGSSATVNFGEEGEGYQSNYGSSQYDTPLFIQNIGNGSQPLTGSVGPISGANYFEDSTGTTCTSFTLASGATCRENLYFYPQNAVGQLNASAVATDNNLSANPATQNINLTGFSYGPPVTVSVTGTGSGSVSSSPSLVNCAIVAGVPTGGGCTATQSTGFTYSLFESPISGYTFTGWGGACSNYGSNQTCTVTITAATSVIANFAPAVIPTDNVAVTLLGSGVGTVTDNSAGINCTLTNGALTGACNFDYPVNSQVTLTAAPAAGTAFAGWGAPCSGTSLTCTFTVTAPLNINATFSQQSFGNVNVCPSGQSTPAPCSQNLAINFNIPATSTLGATQVVTQGISGLDFALAGGNTCTGSLTAGSSCTVNVAFTPRAPGLRMGAVTLYDTTGNPVASLPIYGIGQAPLAVFDPGKQITLPATGLSGVSGVAVDAAGNVFVSESAGAVKITPNGVQSTVPTSGLSAHVYDVAVDGAGDVFLADTDNNRVVEVTPGGVQTTVPATGLLNPTGVAVDGAGNVFITDRDNHRVVKITPSGVQTTVPTSGVQLPYYPAVDAAGDVYFLDAGTELVLKVTPGGVQSTVPISIPGEGNGVAVDAAGDVFVSDQINNMVLEVSPSGIQTTVPTTGLYIPAGLAVDASGNVYIADNGQTLVYEVNRSQLPSLNFALTNVGSTSTDSPKIATLQNVGNQPLSGTATFNSGTSFSELSTCGPTLSLLPGSSCSLNFGFLPQSTGYLTASAVFSDNTLNLSPGVSLQTISLSGIGGINGHAVTAAVPNVVGFTQSVAGSTLTSAGLITGSISTASSSIVPSGSVIASNPAAGSQVSLGSSVKLLISSGAGQPPAPNPLSLLNNYFVTGDYAAAGVTLRGAPVVNNMVTGNISIPASTGPGSPGVPTGADLIDGFLYWTTLESSASPSGSNATFLGYPISGQQIGSDLPYTDTVASVTGTLRVYRADINTYFQNGANGIRTGSGNFTVSMPAGGTNGVLLTEGASLVVIYRVLSPNFPLKAVVIYDGSAIPASSTTQNVQGFYDAAGGGNANGNVTTLFVDSTGWNNTSNIYAFGQSDHYNAALNAGAAYGAVILSTQVNNPDNDGILGAWKAGPASTDFHGGQPGYYDVKTGNWVGLPGARAGQKDLFVQLDYMCGGILSDGSCDPNQENLFPSPDSQGNDPLVMVQKAFANAGVALHLQVGNAVPESNCVDSPGQPCQFPNQPGVIGWKNSLEFSKVWPRNFASCAAGGDCSPRFPYGQKDSYHYVLFGHSLAIPAWNSRYATLTSITAVAGSTTTIVTTDRGAQGTINYCPSRITVSGIQGMPNLNGVYSTSSCPDSRTIIIPTPSGVTNWNYPNSTLPEPVIGITSGTVTSISGYSDLGGADSAVTLGLWATAPNQDMSKRATVIAGTLFHELGHTIGLSHGGLYYDTGNYVPTFEANCKPNYQSIMNYLFQLDGVGPASAIAFSNQALTTLTQSSLGSVTTLAPATFPTSTWYTPSAPSPTASPATLHCDGTPLGGEVGYRVNGSIAPITPAWSNGQNIAFDGQPYSTLRGFNDVSNIDLRQVGATGGQFASLASVLSFDTAATPLNIAPGGSVSVAAGGTVTLGAGGTISVPGGNVTVPTGGTISGGGTITFGTGGNVTLGAGGTTTITPGSNGIVGVPSGGNVTLGAGGTITLGAGGNVTLGAGGNVTLGAGGTISLPAGGGTVTIPSTGGSYTIPAGGTVTLGAGGNITLGAGGNVTLGAGGTVTLGAGGNVTLGGGGNVTLGAGGTITLGGGGNVTLGAGGNITLGGGGTITLGGGGNVTLGAGGNVTLGAGGTVTLGGGGNITLGGGGNVTLGAGGTVTLGAGGNVTLGAGGNVTLGAGGNVTLGGGGTITLGGGGTIIMNAAGNVTLGAGGGTINGVADGPGTYPVGAGGTITLGGGGNVTLGAGGNVTLGGGGTVTLGAGGNITLGGGGTVTLGGGGNVTLGAGGVVTLGGGGNVTLGAGGNITLGGGGNVTLGGGGAASTELDYSTANSIVRPPTTPTETSTPQGVVVNWTAPGFGVVETYTIYRSTIDPPATTLGAPVVIGSVSGVGGNPPATTFTDTNPDTAATTVVYTISTTLAPDPGTSTQRTSAPSTPAVLTVDQTIVLGALPSSVPLSTSSISVTATAESNSSANHQLVNFTSTGSCSAGASSIDTTTGISSAKVVLNSTGSCTITASQAGDSTTIPVVSPAYNAADPVSGTFTIVPQGSNLTAQTITFPQLPYVQYGSGPIAVTASTTSNLPITFTASGSCNNTAGNTTIAITGAGKCTVTASQAGNSTYSAASSTQAFNIAPAVLTVKAGNLTISYGQPIPSLTSDYTITGYVNSESSSVLNNTAPAISTTATSASAPGVYPITVSTGNLAATNYSFLYVPGTLTIQTATATISISNIPSSAVYGGSFTPTYSYSGTGTPTESTTSSTMTVCQVLANGSVSFVGVGTCTLTPSATATANNSAVTGAPQSFQVGMATATISISNIPSSAVYGGSFTPTYSYSGTGTPTESTTSSTTAVCTVSGSTVNFVGVGTCTLTAKATATTDDLAVTGAPQSFNIGKASQAITFAQPASPVTYGVLPITLAATSSSHLAVALTIDASSTAPATISGSTVTIKGAGTLVIDANQVGNTSYAAAPQVQRTIVVNPALLTVTANNLSRAYGAANPTLTVTYTGFVSPDGSSVLTGSPSLSTTAVATSLPGTYPITVTQGTLAARNYTFKFVNGTLTVTYTGSVPSSSTACNGAYSGTFKGSLVVSPGQTCILLAGGTTGTVTDNGGNLVLQGATIGSGVTISSGGAFTIGPSTTINGNLTITSLPRSTTANQVCGSTITSSLVFQSNGAPVLIGSGTPSCAGNIIKGSLQVTSNSAAVTMDGNKVSGSVQVQSNSGATTIDGNTVGGSLQDQSNTGATQVFTNVIANALQCQSNTSITGGGNTAPTKQGQCAKF